MKRRDISTTAIMALVLVACGPDGNSSGGNQNNVVDRDAYVFPDAKPRPDASQCENRCNEGQVQCVTGGFQVCGNYDADSCLEWGPVTPCDTGEKCTDGKCQAGGVDDCVKLAVRCDPDTTTEGTQSCELGQDGFYHWSQTTACDTGETCSAGKCSSTCHDECAEDSRQCAGDGYQVCADHNSDGCMDWGPITACQRGETCSNGNCSVECTNECANGAKRCDGVGGYQQCGDFDADSCLEWGSTIACADGETCSNGVCGATCQNECDTEDEHQCTVSGDGYQVCSVNNDTSTCFTWGPVISCDQGQACQSGTCIEPCNCDFFPGICEASAPGSSQACSCDLDCGSACTADSHCDTWCPAGSDPDCSCGCDYNEYCEAAAQNSTDTCSCDPDCELNEDACSDDGHCDTWCPADDDPDCAANADPCRDRWMSIGWRWGDELILYDSYEDPDSVEGDSWVLLSPGLSSGSAEIFVEFAKEHSSCVDSIRVEVYGYDDSFFGDGAEMYLYNWDTFQFDLLPDQTVGSTEDLYNNDVANVEPYMYCGSQKCYVNAKVGASAWDNTHVLWVEVYVHMAP